MSYFNTNYSRINYPIVDADGRGLRNAQLGAIHSIGSHFTISENIPALVVMPTGSGKTAVLNLAAYLLRANRILVISSSVMVRGQIVEEFASLKTLKESNVFHAELETPKVKELRSPIRSLAEWEIFLDFDVIVGIPNSINEGINDDFRPPSDLFDLILVDEAHHMPAYTWNNVVKAFPEAKKIYFTATPFRRDKKEIEGKIIYVYPLSKAYDDKIFGDIGYYPVVTDDANVDLAIAKETERIFNLDKISGLEHFIMVRTETKDHAELLRVLYEKETALKLKKVDSTLTYSTIKKTIVKLKNQELDGIICVDMLGEGFDFPNLKIAAIHSPKKSLANTLQFIGRFARTNAENIGEAKFLAIPSDIEIGKKKLYEEGAIWNEIIKNLSENVIDEEDETKRVLDSFENEDTEVYEKEDISFYNLNPYCHVKIYKASGINLDEILELSGHKTLYHAISREHNAVIFITKESERPKWIITNDLINVKHYFFLLYYDTVTELIFLHSSIKTVQFYDELIEKFAVGVYTRLPKYQLNKVLLNITNPEFFNIGMQNRSSNSGESYLIKTGSNAENTIRKSHSKNYSNGHVFLKGMSEGSNITVGYSSGSKVWSNAYEKIPSFINWCKILALKIISDQEVKTNTGFDNLPIGKVVDNFQLSAHAATWHHDTFSEIPFLLEVDGDEVISTFQLLDFHIEIDKALSDLNQLAIDLILDNVVIRINYDFVNYFTLRQAPAVTFMVETNGQTADLVDYLNESPLQIYLDDFATIANHEFYAPPKEGDYQYAAEKILATAWNNANTDITREFYSTAQEKNNNNSRNSIHETLHDILLNEHNNVLIYDHGTGEVADFITVNELNDKIEIKLYHVKGSSGANPGDRVSDVYEVCMQAVKSQVWTSNKLTFKTKIVNRTRDHGDKYLSGSQQDFVALMNKNKRVEFSFAIVQPGISQNSLSAKLSHILAAADDSIINNGYEPLVVLGS